MTPAAQAHKLKVIDRLKSIAEFPVELIEVAAHVAALEFEIHIEGQQISDI